MDKPTNYVEIAMDLSDLKGVKNTKETVKLNQKASAPDSRQRTAQELNSTQVVAKNDSVSVNPERKKTLEKNQARSEINQVIDVINVADEATDEIEKIVRSIGGIVKQVDEQELPDERKQVLEQEANELVDEIKRKAQTSSNGVQPLLGQKVRLEIENSVGRSLEVLIPDDADSAFGIGKIEFSKKDTIIDVRTAVAIAKERINEIRTNVSEAKNEIQSLAEAFDIAQLNAEASESSVRDLDRALEIVGEAKKGIAGKPEQAVDAVGQFREGAVKLLD